jgi:hypothetical protein
VRLVRSGGFRGVRAFRMAFVACVAAAAALLAWRAWSAPAMNAELFAYWKAVEDGDREAATTARAAFDGMHRAADAAFRVTLFLVLGALASLPAALMPGPAGTAVRTD